MFAYLMAWINTYMSDEEGQGMTEYALILVLIAIAAIAVMATLGTTISNIFGDAQSALGG